MDPIFHLTSRAEWEAARARGSYRASTLAGEGFCHCSHLRQVEATASRYFKGRRDLVLLEIRPERLTARLVDEDLTGRGELFPHVYGPIDLAAVAAVHDFPPGPEGSFVLPPGLSKR